MPPQPGTIWTPKPLGVPEIKLPRPKRKSPRRSAEEQGDDLFSALRACRTRLAAERRVPAYIILADSALRDMARLQPTSLNEMLGVKGMGVMKASQYGDAFFKRCGPGRRNIPPRPARHGTDHRHAPGGLPGCADAGTHAGTSLEPGGGRTPPPGLPGRGTVKQLCAIHQRKEDDIRARLRSLGLAI